MRHIEVTEKLEAFAGQFWKTLDVLHRPQPETVWHYTSFRGICGVLETGRLWLTSSRQVEDDTEILWGNSLVKKSVVELATELGDHPALRVLLDERTQSVFLRQHEMFLACFTPDADSPRQWERPGVSGGGAFVFDGIALSGILRTSHAGGTALMAVQYDESLLVAVTKEYLRSAIKLASVTVPGTDVDEYWRVVAQYLIEPGGLSFLWKQPTYEWEREWRLVRRAFVSPKEVFDHPRRVEIALDGTVGLIRKIVLGPEVHVTDAARIRALARERWRVPVESSCCAAGTA